MILFKASKKELRTLPQILTKSLAEEAPPPVVFLGKGVLKIYSKLQSIFIKNALRHGCSSINLLHFFRKPFPKNTSGELVLVWWTASEFRESIQIKFTLCWMIKNSFAKTSVKYFNCHDRQTKGNIVIYLFLEVFSKDYVRLYHSYIWLVMSLVLDIVNYNVNLNLNSN